MKTTVKLILTSLTGVMLVGTSNAEIDAAMLKKGCVNKGNSWVIGADGRGVCVPQDPCSSKDKKIRQSFCVTNDNDIPLDVKGDFALVFDRDGSCSKLTKDERQVVEKKDCEAANLNPGQWAVKFYYGTVKGAPRCGSVRERDGMAMLDQSEAEKCSCLNWGVYTHISDTNAKIHFKISPVFVNDYGDFDISMIEKSEAKCKDVCIYECVDQVLSGGKDIRREMYGLL